MSDAAHEFWTSDHRYEDLARSYEQDIELTHPDYVTSNEMCICLDWCGLCSWAATNVTYYEYCGESV